MDDLKAVKNMDEILTANLVVVWFPEPQADFLEVPEEGVAEQMDLKKKEIFYRPMFYFP